MIVLSCTVLNRVVSEFYGPVVVVEYEEGRWTKTLCRREVHQEKSTGRWLFTADNTMCSPALSKAITAAYNNVVELRRSSRPPSRSSISPPAQSLIVNFKDQK
jgi:hypothetical protein